MKDLSALREEIDRIDDELAALFKRRLAVVGDIAAFKAEHGVAVTDVKREADILSRVMANSGAEAVQETKRLFEAIFEISKSRQRRTVANGAD